MSSEDYLDKLLKQMMGDIDPAQEFAEKPAEPEPASEAAPENNTEETPSIDEEIPTIGEEIASINEEIPSVEGDIPSVDEEIPSIDTDFPSIDTEIPSVEGDIPSIDEEIPSIDTDIPSIDTEIPSIEGEVPSVDTEIPSIDEPDLISDSDEKIIIAEQNISHDMEIPMDVDTMGVVIDSAPSLEPAKEAPLDSEIADLMADIMPSFDAGLTSVSEELAAEAHKEVSEDNPVIDIPEIEIPAVEPVAEEAPAEEPVIEVSSDEPGLDIPSLDIPPEVTAEVSAPSEETPADDILNPDDIAAMIEQENIEATAEEPSIEIPEIEIPAEEPVAEEAPAEGSSSAMTVSPDDVNPDDIAELLANENTIFFGDDMPAGESAAEESAVESVAEESAVEESASDEPAIVETVPGEADSAVDGSVPEMDINAELAALNAELEADDGMGEEDIEAMLAKAREEGEAEQSGEEMPLGDLIDTSNDGEVDAIGDLLDKAERNEAIDAGAIDNITNGPAMPDPFDERAALQEAAADSKESKKAERKRLKEEKAAARKKAKEEKAAAKAAKKAQKSESSAPSTPGSDNVGADLHDTDLSDVEALLAGAEIAGSMTEAPEPDAAPASGDGRVELTEDSVGFSEPMEDVFSNFGLDTGELSSAAEESPSGSPVSDTAESAPDVDIPSEGGTSSGTEEEGGKKPSLLDKIKGIFSKIGGALAESDDEEDESGELMLSDENAQVLEELEQEGDGGKKKKDKKAKKDKGSSPDGEGGEGGEEGTKKDKKPKKEKKHKKEKAPAPDDGKPGKKIPLKNIVMVVIVCGMFAAVLFIIVRFAGDFSIKKAGRAAFKNEDYQTCYQDLFGKDLNETETIMFNSSECILRIRLWLREYEILSEEGSEVRALDSLIQSVNAYPGLYASAVEWRCLDKVEPTYSEMLSILSQKYGLSAEEAVLIASEPDDIVYTRLVNAIAGGSTYTDAMNQINGIPSESEAPLPEPEPEPEPLYDLLPEEDGVTGEGFVENND